MNVSPVRFSAPTVAARQPCDVSGSVTLRFGSRPDSSGEEPGFLSLLWRYGQGRLGQSWRQWKFAHQHKREQDEREAQARRMHAFDAFRPNGYYDDDGQLIAYPRKQEIIRNLTPLIDDGFDKTAMYTVLRPIVTHDHPAIRRDFVEILLGRLRNDQAKAFVLSHFIPSLKEDRQLENRQRVMDVIETLPPDPLPPKLHYLLVKPEEQSHLRYWAGQQFSEDRDADLRSRAEAVIASSMTPSSQETGRKKKLPR